MTPTMLEQALETFKRQMLAKFQARASKYGVRSVTLVGDSLLHEPGVYAGLWDHFEAECEELRDACAKAGDTVGEAIDVANMAFLIWWHDGGEWPVNAVGG